MPRTQPPTVGQIVTRIESGERVRYRIVEVDESARTVRMEIVNVAGYLAIGRVHKASYAPPSVAKESLTTARHVKQAAK